MEHFRQRGRVGAKALGALTGLPVLGRPIWLDGEMRPEWRGLQWGERGAHTFSSLPIPSLLQRSPAWMTTRLSSHSWLPPGRPWTAHQSSRS